MLVARLGPGAPRGSVMVRSMSQCQFSMVIHIRDSQC